MRAPTSVDRQTDQTTEGLRLIVTTADGADRFAVAPSAQTRVGSDPGCDIVVLGGSGEPRIWFEIDSDERRPRLFAHVDGLIAAGQTLAAGEELRLRLPARISFDGTTMSLVGDGSEGAFDRIGSVFGAIGTGAGDALSGGGAGGGSRMGLLALAGGAVLLVAASLLPGGAGSGRDPQEVRSERMETYGELLGSALTSLSLQDSVRVEQRDGTVVLKGQVSQAEMERLASAVRRTGIPGSMLVSELNPLPGEAPVAPYFTGASVAPEKFVITRDGRRVMLGEEVTDGYRLSALDADGATLTRGLFVIRVDF